MPFIQGIHPGDARADCRYCIEFTKFPLSYSRAATRQAPGDLADYLERGIDDRSCRARTGTCSEKIAGLRMAFAIPGTSRDCHGRRIFLGQIGNGVGNSSGHRSQYQNREFGLTPGTGLAKNGSQVRFQR